MYIWKERFFSVRFSSWKTQNLTQLQTTKVKIQTLKRKKYDLAAILEANEPILWGKFGRYTQHKLMTNCCFRNCTLITFAVQQKNHMISNRISLVAENFPEKQIPRRPCVGSAVPCS